MNLKRELILIRHGEVDLAWKGICYGALDVPLSNKGMDQSLQLAKLICQRWKPSEIYHSGLTRTQFLAEAIAQACPAMAQVKEDIRLRERNYGDWQGRTWDEAYATDPENFHGLIEAPDSYRPPGGESTSEVQHRAISWLMECHTVNANGPIMAVAHSGSIASIAGHVLRLHSRDWAPWTIKTLECLSFTHPECVDSDSQYSVERIAFDLFET